jgi:hypothetical protein
MVAWISAPAAQTDNSIASSVLTPRLSRSTIRASAPTHQAQRGDEPLVEASAHLIAQRRDRI